MQQMDEGKSSYDQPERGYSGYQAEQEYNRQGYTDSYPQREMKIRPNTSGQLSAGQRLALAIVSVSIIGLLGIIIGSNTAVGFGGYFVLGIVVLAFLLINGLFNRWGIF